jgi:hypothetical protein
LKLKITIDCNKGSRFDEPGDEVARLLRVIADAVEGQSKLAILQGFTSRIYDLDQNHVGQVAFTERKRGAPSA